jgi:hypothetical protein
MLVDTASQPSPNLEWLAAGLEAENMFAVE